MVRDSHAAPIRDLRNDDFALQVAGKPQSFQVHGPISDQTSAGRGLVVVVIDTMHMRWQEEKDVRLNAGKFLAVCAKRDLPVSLLLFSRNAELVPVHEFTTTSETLAAALEQANAEMHHKPQPAGATPGAVEEGQRFAAFYKLQGKFQSAQAIEEYPGAILGGFKRVANYILRFKDASP